MERVPQDRPSAISLARVGSLARSSEPCVVAETEQALDRLGPQRIRLLVTQERDRSCRTAQQSCAHVLSDRWMPPDLAASFEPRPVPQTRTSRCSPLGRAQPRRSALSLRSVLWLMALRQAPSTPNWGRSALYTRLGDPRATLGLGRTKTPCQTRPLVLGMAAEEAAERGAGGNIVDDTRAPRSE